MKQQKPCYSTSWYKEKKKKEEYTPSFIPEHKQKISKSFTDENHPLTPFKGACKRLKTLGAAMEKGVITHINGGKFVYREKY